MLLCILSSCKNAQDDVNEMDVRTKESESNIVDRNSPDIEGPKPSVTTKSGKDLFDTHCAKCHKVFTNVDQIEDIPTFIEDAISTIPAMKSVADLNLSSEQINAIADYISSEELQQCRDETETGKTVIRRLTQSEYKKTVKQLFGYSVPSSIAFPPEDTGLFSNTANKQHISDDHINVYLDIANQIADDTVQKINSNQTQSNQVASIVSQCLPKNAGQFASCNQEIVAKLVPLLFRNTHLNNDINRYRIFFDASYKRLNNNFNASLKQLLKALLISPKFIFKLERSNSNLTKLNATEFTNRLSYFIWGSPPDETLVNLAKSGQILNDQTLKNQIIRMLKDAKSFYLVDTFFSEWFRLNELHSKSWDTQHHPQMNNQTITDMRKETNKFLNNLIKNDKNLSNILTANYSIINGNLARYYGLTSSGEGFAKYDLSQTPRRGILGHASILSMTSGASESSPVRRGVWILSHLLCDTPKDPPPGVDNLAQASKGTTVKERLEQHRNDPSCYTCHKSIDPLGFGLESFNALGKFRENYSDGLPVDSTATLPNGKNIKDSLELNQALSEDPRFSQCVAKKFISFALGKGLLHSDRCLVNSIVEGSKTAGFKVSELIYLISKSESFTYKKGD